MSNSRRNRQRRQRPGSGSSSPSRSDRAGWRRKLDPWGGLPVLAAAILLPAVIVIIVVMVSRADEDSAAPDFVPTARSETSGRVEGSPEAPVRIVEFADFSCGHCRGFATETHPQLLTEFIETGTVSLEYHYVAFLGEGSALAAEAAECALDQGAFWEMHDLLFLRQAPGVFSEKNLKQFGRELAEQRPEFDVNRFGACIESREKRQVVQQLMEEADALGVTSTPTFLVNGEMLRGNRDIASFRELVGRHLVD